MVQILYLDESGDVGWPDPYGNSDTDHFVLGGAILDDQMAKSLGVLLRRHWDAVLDERDATAPTPAILKDIPTLPYFHFTDMLAGKEEPWNHFNRERRLELIDEVLADMKDLGIRFTGDVLKKKALKDKHGDNAWPPFKYLLANVLGRFQRDLKASQGVGLCVMDAQGHHREKTVREEYEGFVTRGTTLSRNPNHPAHTLDNIIDVVMFSPSRYAPGVQAADFAAAVLFQKFERGDPTWYDQTKSAWNRPRKGRDPSVVP